MFTNLSEKYKSILEHRIDLEFFEYHNLHFWSLDYSDVDDFDLSQFSLQRNIVVLNEKIKPVQNIDKFRKLISSCYIFTKYNLLEYYGIPESTFYFNCLFDDVDYFISNNNIRTQDINYDGDTEYSSIILNNCNKFTVNPICLENADTEDVVKHVICALSCGCSVYVNNDTILELFNKDDIIYLNKDLNQEEKLKAQEHFHFKYGYTYQSSHIKIQLIGILGDREYIINN